ncbi:thioesterase II family protein [Streptomyces silvensis]|uniref:Thioesterase n=1 Tax=Streptomyces silvensis TaxID=1765722 RepID=A0A0W7X890_9ACTN|nr:alpha/beta fold hydrolase [Streptomyces silvensis]KUF19102.1 thioesterase [Streptomyces silvensis]
MPSSTSPTPLAVRLFVLHHAGGSHLTFRHWPRLLPGTWQVRLLDAPGHGRLLDMEPAADAGRLADFLLERLEPELHDPAPFAFFGHSMGAVLAYEMTRRLAVRGRALPVWLGLSARGAPPGAGRGPHARHTLDDAALQAHLRRLGGTPAEVLDSPAMWARFAPLIRTDLRLVDSYTLTPGTPRLPVACCVYGGRADGTVPRERLAAWQDLTDRFGGVRLFDGGHFYFLDDPAPLLAQITGDLSAALAATRTAAAPN